MDSFEMSKIAGAACAALLLIFGTKTLIDLRLADHGAPGAATHAPGATKPAAGEGAQHAAAAAGGEAAPAQPAEAPKAAGFDAAQVISLVAAANPDAGKASFAKCAACHTAEKGAGNKLGPNLWGIIGRPRASIADFTGYSAAMKEKGGSWSYADLAQFINSPASLVKGTKMIFPGIKDPQAIADVLAYIRTLADTPAELPK